MKLLMKVFVFCLVSCVTWMATSAIMAHQKKRKPTPTRQANSVAATPTVTQTATVVENAAPMPPMKLGISGAIVEAYLRSRTITIADGVASVSAHVSLADKRPGMSYVWRLRVVDSDEQPLSGRVYDNQLFSVDSSGTKEIDFQDQVAVPPGAYRVELVLYEKSPANDLSFLDNDSLARGYERVRAVKVLNR